MPRHAVHRPRQTFPLPLETGVSQISPLWYWPALVTTGTITLHINSLDALHSCLIHISVAVEAALRKD